MPRTTEERLDVAGTEHLTGTETAVRDADTENRQKLGKLGPEAAVWPPPRRSRSIPDVAGRQVVRLVHRLRDEPFESGLDEGHVCLSVDDVVVWLPGGPLEHVQEERGDLGVLQWTAARQHRHGCADAARPRRLVTRVVPRDICPWAEGSYSVDHVLQIQVIPMIADHDADAGHRCGSSARVIACLTVSATNWISLVVMPENVGSHIA